MTISLFRFPFDWTDPKDDQITKERDPRLINRIASRSNLLTHTLSLINHFVREDGDQDIIVLDTIDLVNWSHFMILNSVTAAWPVSPARFNESVAPLTYCNSEVSIRQARLSAEISLTDTLTKNSMFEERTC